MVTQRYNELNFKECNLEPSKYYENVIIANKEASKTQKKTVKEIENVNWQNIQKFWIPINYMTGRKSAKKVIIKGDNNEERINEWFNNFKNLLGGAHIDETNTFEPDIIYEGTLDIDSEVFTKEEYLAVKNNLIDGRYVGPDGIAPEAFKYCNFDDIILEYANRVLIDGK